MATLQLDSTIPSAALPGIARFANLAYEKAPEVLGPLFKTIKSNQRTELFAAIYGIGLMQSVGQGGAHSGDFLGEAYRIEISPTKYSTGLIMTHDAVINNLYPNEMINKASALGETCAYTKELVRADVFNNAFSASAYACGDGKEICATDHPTLAGNVSNEMTTPAALSEQALEQSEVDIMAINDFRGLRANFEAKQLIIPNVLKFEAERILKSSLRVDTPDNTVNALKNLNIISDVVMSKHLSSSTKWFRKTDLRADDGLIFIDREALEIYTYVDNPTRNQIYAAWVNFGTGVINPFALYGVAA